MGLNKEIRSWKMKNPLSKAECGADVMEDIILHLPGVFSLHPREVASKLSLLTCTSSLLQAVGWEDMAFIFLNRFLDLTDVSREFVPRVGSLPVTTCAYLMVIHSASGN